MFRRQALMTAAQRQILGGLDEALRPLGVFFEFHGSTSDETTARPPSGNARALQTIDMGAAERPLKPLKRDIARRRQRLARHRQPAMPRPANARSSPSGDGSAAARPRPASARWVRIGWCCAAPAASAPICRLCGLARRSPAVASRCRHVVIGRVPAAGAETGLAVRIHDAEIMLGVLIEVLRGDAVAAERRLARQRDIALEHLIGIAADFHARPVAVEGLRSAAAAAAGSDCPVGCCCGCGFAACRCRPRERFSVLVS